LIFVYDKKSGTKTIDFEKDEVRKLFASSIKACDISRFDLFVYEDGNLVLWNNPSIEIIKENRTDETQIKISTEKGYRTTVYAYSFVKDKRAA